MNILLDELPEEIEVCGKKYPINTDFRVWIRFEEILTSAKPEEAITYIILSCMKKEGAAKLPPSLKETLKAICDFYFCREDVKSKDVSCARTKRLYSFSHDADLIYAAFIQQYGIDLIDIPYLHWWKFQALFKGLSEESRIMKIIGYRNVDMNDIKDKNMKKMYQKLKDAYALPDTRTDKEKENAFNDALSNLF